MVTVKRSSYTLEGRIVAAAVELVSARDEQTAALVALDTGLAGHAQKLARAQGARRRCDTAQSELEQLTRQYMAR